ncbi:energy transducer TonB [Pseudomonas sp. 148P]|uniref:Energy transducer TonB n=1 Tax=Pseudomonas ulcerans TaxID=3115852 RepID=A0ABU7HUH0_9PSED|nr:MULTISPECIES: energy transducer TonB [unclassified Pseudomonas]MEE1924069.1 energy transducer TonB [Pseudomonas sp. 147P]MEE1935168.1 energy transducer TonB [Pseudomonas sp. 148P]
MSSLSLPMNTPLPAFGLPNWRGHTGAAGLAVALHVAVALALLGHDYRPTLPAPVVPVITTQLVSVPAPVPEPVAPVVEAAPPVIEPPAPPEVVKAPAPVVPTQAELAFKRVQQREKQERVAEQKRQRQEQQRQEQARQAQQREEQLAREAAEAQQRLAAERRAADERARAAAASQQYLPVSKKAPDYPQRALDKGVQGDCTVSYTVDTQGRVRDPQVLEGCHPWLAQPSLQAARSFRYQPRVVDGRTMEVPGVRNTFHYSIEQGSR